MKPNTFYFLGFYDGLEDLQDRVCSLPLDEWEYFTFRQKNIVGHRDTRTIPLIFDHAKKNRHIEHRNFFNFSSHLETLSEFARLHGLSGETKRANLVKLLAGAEIKTHIDKGVFLSSLHRVHLPIFTNPLCEFRIENEVRVLGEGEIWDINNTGKRHSVHNFGENDRVHLIVDIT